MSSLSIESYATTVGTADNIQGGTENDTMYGGDDNDTLNGGQHNDQLYGESGNDYVAGGLGSDSLYGENGNDSLYAGQDNDLLVGGAGNDYLAGGSGNDIYYFGNASGNDMVAAFDNPGAGIGDIIRFDIGLNGSNITNPNSVLSHITYSNGNAVIDLGGGHNVTILGVAVNAFTSDDFEVL